MQFDSIEQMIAASANGVRPAERLTVSQAAEKYRYLNNPGSFVGYWDNTVAPYLIEPMDTLTSTDYIGMVFVGPARTGKALPLYTPIPTPSGWTTMGELKVGDPVLGRAGRPCHVVAATGVMLGHTVYRITFDDGSSIEADAGHKWYVETKDGGRAVLSTARLAVDYLSPTSAGVRSRYCVPVASALQLPDADLPIPPYTFGVWLGDGSVQSGALTLFADDADRIRDGIASEGGHVTERHTETARARDFTVKFSTERRDTLVGRLRKLGFVGAGKSQRKHIPVEYQRASESQRRQLLRGLMDTDGTLVRGSRVCEFSTSNQLLASDVRELLCGLGYKPRVRSKLPSFMYKGERKTGRKTYTVVFSVHQGDEAFRLPRYVDAVDSCQCESRPSQTGRRWIRRIEEVATTPVRCIQVDSPDSLFLAGESMIPTHNSDMFFNWLGYTAKCDPADMMHVLMTQHTARDWSQKDLRRMFRHSKEVGKEVAPGRANQSTHSVRFLSGMHLLVKWPTITELSGKTVGRNWISDYDRIPESIDGEGNAYDLTAKRGQTFRRNAMTVAESSPGYEIEDPKWVAKTPHEAPPTKGILALYNRGDRRRWYWRCPHCTTAFEPDFKLLMWPDSHDHVEAAEQAYLVCPHCGCMIYHEGKNGDPGKHELNQTELGNAHWVKDGMLWVPAKAGSAARFEGRPYRSDIASFWMKGPAAAFTDWRELVLRYLKAEEEFERTGSQEALKTTVNTDQGLPFKPKGLDIGRLPEDVQAAAIEMEERVVPNWVRFLVATIDVQKSRFVVQVHGISDSADYTVIDRFAVKKSQRLDEDGERMPVRPASYPEDWDLLIDAVLLKTYPLGDDSGRHMAIRMVGCDSGGLADLKRDSSVTKSAYQFWRRLRDSDGTDFPIGLHRRFMLLKGDGERKAPRVQISYPDSERKDRHAGARGDVPVLRLNTDALKDQLNVMLDRKEDGGRVIFPKWLPDWFWSEVCAETRTTDGWKKLTARNEAWDLLVYAIALCLYKPIRIETLNWEDPPDWAAPWAANTLVFGDPAGLASEPEQKAPVGTLRDLAAALA